jgi:hypothetical protein
LYTTFSTKINKKNKTKKKFGKNYTSSIKSSGVSSKNKGKTVDMLIWCGIKNFYK